MDDKLKREIAERCREYRQERGVSLNDLAKISGINVCYLSGIEKDCFAVANGRTGGTVEIGDKWFTLLADAIGYQIQKNYWPHVQTPQFEEIVYEMEIAKNEAATRTIIGRTGSGKSYAVAKFKAQYPTSCFVVTCHAHKDLISMVNSLLRELGLSTIGSRDDKLQEIKINLWRRYRRGDKPVVIFDEAENLKVEQLKSIKTIYDFLRDASGVVLIGTRDLVYMLEDLKAKNEAGCIRAIGMSQLYSRLRAGIRFLPDIDARFMQFVSDADAELKKWLIANCDDYRELRDRLEPVRREADKLGCKVDKKLLNLIIRHDDKSA